MDKPSEKERDLILEASYQASNALLNWSEMTFDKLTDINKYLIGIATLLIPIIGALTIPHKQSYLTLGEKIMIQHILSTLLLAIIFGFGQIIHEYIILKFYTYQNSKRAETLYDNQNKSYKKALKEADKYRIKGDFFVYSFFTFPFCLLIEGGIIINVLQQVSGLVNSFLFS